MQENFYNNPNVSQRNINMIDFIESRSNEINYLHNTLSTKINSLNKLAFQTLPKHLRRRAMSHNRYRIPSKMRLAYDSEVLKKPIKNYKRCIFIKKFL